ncbi:hypothetical protein CAPTEDRAFT_213869 [Capitella teleta]|uniref:Ubiquitin carboxyl-terminal hydrolase n=1 Tax=Capitella teleta TaxID=283909 RepID=R7U0C7_CAPTE|nr:hypothetical protein CAPTEDRAFT_213869 [Capitella teleta]|eukprot:ELT97121.1 hypothetical protein CAPTEDRAFT_213869 [Capitella teleta]
MTNTVTQTKFTLNLPVSTPVKVFTEEVAKQLGYVADSFNIIYERCQDGDTSEVNVKVFEDQAMGDMCLFDGGRKRNNFTIMDKDDQQPVRVECKATDSSYDLDKFSVRSENQYTSSSSNYTSSYGGYNYSHVSPIMISETGYVGLVNQAMTCYLSSLLQTLYMTPEFRNAVYRWEYDGTPEEAVKSIPYQLQRLFLQLQTSKKRAIETTDITKSFGWESSEAWQQHDVQELCRVMFDALEKKWKKTDQANLINRLYQGHLKDYVKCLKCGKESARTDAYLDIPLVIRPFGSETAYQSVNEALNAFVEPEILNGCNQYFCDHCNLKCDAHKGLKFISFPYILTLQLKRFDFDYVTMHRIKLNDCVEFPEILNLNHLIEDPQTDSTEKKSGAASDSCEHSDEGIGDEVEMGCSASGSASEETDDSTSISASDAEAATNDRNALHSKQAGPYEYELFSIMIHSGSAAGGHYYAYIKSFIDGRWYSFNDQHVSAITNDDIKKTHGGSNFSKGSYFSPSAYTSSTNAYMLMYRQIDKAKNKEPLKVEDFPEHLKQALSSVNEQAETERRQRELERCTCRIRVYFHNPFLDRMLDTKLEIHRDQTLSDAVEMAWKHFEMDKKFSRDCVRLVKYEEALDYIDHSWEGHDDDPMGSLLGGVKTLYSFDLLMEVKNPQEEFEEYKSGERLTNMQGE